MIKIIFPMKIFRIFPFFSSSTLIFNGDNFLSIYF